MAPRRDARDAVFGRPATVVGRTRAGRKNAEITEMMMYTDADGEDAGWARRARKEDAASAAASGGERSVSTQRLEVRQRVLRLSSPLLAAGFERFDHFPDLIGRR